MTAPATTPRLPPDDVLERLSASGLRGRGGGWFPAARKWHAVRVEGGTPVVIANGAEGEPGSFKDRFVMLRQPAEIVTGLALAAQTVGAREAVVFLKRGDVARPAAKRDRSHGWAGWTPPTMRRPPSRPGPR